MSSITPVAGRRETHKFTLRQQHLIVFLIYALLTLLMTWPVVGQLGSFIPGKIGDAYVHLWTFEWFKSALLNGTNPFYTDALFYPVGASLVFHNVAWLHLLAWLPLQAVVGSGAAYSLVFLFGFVVNGFGTYLFARDLTDSFPASFVSGLIAGFWPYALSHHGHPNLVLIGWIPLAMRHLRLMLREGRVRDALWAGIYIALIGITRWQLLALSFWLIGFYTLYQIITTKRQTWVRKVKLLCVALGVAILLMLPLGVPLIAGQITRDNPDELFLDEELPYGADLLSYLVPNRYHPLWGDRALDLYWGFFGTVYYTRTVGFVTLLLVLIGVFKGGRRAYFWTFAALFYFMLALGDTLHINGVPIVSLPYNLIEDWFAFKIVRFPDRFNIILGIPVAILAGLGTASLIRQPRLKSKSTILIVVICTLIIIEYANRYEMLPLDVPDWYETVAEEPGEFAIFGFPLYEQGKNDKTYMYYQLIHGKPIAQGHISRPSAESMAFLNSIPLLSKLRGVKDPPLDIVNVPEQLEQLWDANIRYFVLHKDDLRENHEAAWRKWLVIPPLYEDDEMAAYSTKPRIVGQDVPISHPVLRNPSGQAILGVVDGSLNPPSVPQAAWTRVDSAWGTTEALSQDYAECILLRDQHGQTYTADCQPLVPELPSSQWEANDMVHSRHQLQLSPYLNAGDYQVLLSLQDASGDTIGEPAPIGVLELEALPRTFTKPSPSQPTEYRWEDAITLVGFDLDAQSVDQGETTSSSLTLYWHALRRIDTSYKFFIHVIDPSSGEPQAQIDYLPGNWSYPTDWWEEGEYISDNVILPLNDLPDGSFDLRLGIYDPDTGERLTVSNTDGTAVPDQAVTLTSLEH